MQNGSVTVKAATLEHIEGIVALASDIQEEKGAHENTPLNYDDFFGYVSSCIASPGIYVFVAEDKDKVRGLLILNEFSCPWNRAYTWASDLLFISQKGGPKLLRLARTMKELKGWDKLLLSTTTTNERADRFYSHFGDKVGSVFELN